MTKEELYLKKKLKEFDKRLEQNDQKLANGEISAHLYSIIQAKIIKKRSERLEKIKGDLKTKQYW